MSNRIGWALSLIAIALGHGGCGTTTGNPPTGTQTGDTADISISSEAYSTSASAAGQLTQGSPSLATRETAAFFGALNPAREIDTMAAATAKVTAFKFCVRRIILEGEDGVPRTKTGETGDKGEVNPSYIKFAPGLIDVGSGEAKSWGKANIPVGFKLARVKVIVQEDVDLCGVKYSVGFNGKTTTDDVEFKWKLDPAIDLTKDTGTIWLSLSKIVYKLLNPTEDSIKASIEAVEDDGKK